MTLFQADGNTENIMLQDYPEPGGKEPWKPLFDELRKRMAKRGLESAMLMGMVSDFWPSKEQATALKEVSGGLPWINACHYYQTTFHDGLAGFGYQASYFSTKHGYGRNLLGWRSKEMHAAFDRVQLDNMPVNRWRLIAEQSITGSAIGIGRLGADNWFAVKDKNGVRKARAMHRYPTADWGYLNANSSALAAGPAGPVATMRYEALREGVQECEALICVEDAVTDSAKRAKLGDELAARCEAALKERNWCMWRGYGAMQSGPRASVDCTSWRERCSPTGYTWYIESDWQERSETIYRLAGEVAKRLGS